ncbi:MAG TPA: TonB-dependent receptor [Devosia sp.]|nr:TonB-dependent receptor [Devosia sp.]
MKSFKLRYLASGAVVALACSFATTAFAEDEIDTEQTSGDIIVTAQGRSQNLQDVPVAVSVVSGDQLEKMNIKSLQDLSSHVANVKITTGTLVNSINIRGVGSGENPGFEQAVATFADGVYRSRSQTTSAALFDIERIEVLKGPQTTFFGANASAGALNITTRKPNGKFEYNGTVSYAVPDGEYNVEGGVSMPITSTLSGRVAGRISGMDGYVDMGDKGKGPDTNGAQGRISLNWTPSSNWTTDFRADYVHKRTENFAPFQLTNCPPGDGFPMSPVCGQILGGATTAFDTKLDFNSQALPSHYYFDYFETVMANSWDLGAATLRSTTAYSDMKGDSRVSLVPVGFVTATQGFDPFPVSSTEKYKFFSQELRLESNTGGAFDYMVGAYYSHGKLNYDTLAGFFFLPFGGIVEDVFGDYPDFDATSGTSGSVHTQVTDDMYSAFAALTLRPTNGIEVNLGGRYVKVDKAGHRGLEAGNSVNGIPGTFEAYTQPGVGNQPPLQVAYCIITGCTLTDFSQSSRSDDAFLPSANIQFDVADDVMLYAKYNKGFKAGGFSTTSTPSVFGPEHVNAYEVGMKSKLFDRAVTLNVSAFRMDYTGLQETTFDQNLTSQITNVAGARSQGIEVGLNARASDAVSFFADVAYLDAKYTDYTDGECTKFNVVNTPKGSTCVQDLTGKSRANAPEWSGSVGINFTLPAGENEFTIDPVMNFSSAYYMTATADPLFRQDGYAEFDLRLGYGPQDGLWNVAVVGRNLTNKVVTNYRLGVPGGDGSITALVDRGRSVAIQFSIRN